MEKAMIQPLIAALISFLIATRAYRRKSLDLSGALAGFVVMTIHIALGYRYGAMLLVFFFTSSKLTKRVRRGTNGGVTKAGLLAAAAAGSVIGLTFVVFGFFTTRCAYDVALKQLLVVPLSALAGVCGSLIDSLLGATLQFSGFCSVRNKVVGKPGPTVKRISGLSILDNNGVNLVSILLTTMLTSIACKYIF
ncbi:Transmembrane protein 19 [Morella rubra]|uniref:Transmembrane protein 19 n=1 Tax=Morella rubra TaxID=262757 RepID=A0A6A1W4G9_9ROSI|nr:Transmembrane protein 19 [Morella rubra]